MPHQVAERRGYGLRLTAGVPAADIKGRTARMWTAQVTDLGVVGGNRREDPLGLPDLPAALSAGKC